MKKFLTKITKMIKIRILFFRILWYDEERRLMTAEAEHLAEKRQLPVSYVNAYAADKVTSYLRRHL